MVYERFNFGTLYLVWERDGADRLLRRRRKQLERLNEGGVHTLGLPRYELEKKEIFAPIKVLAYLEPGIVLKNFKFGD